MPSYNDYRQIPYTPSQLFDIVSDIERYHEFLPWIHACRIKERDDNVLIADMSVGFGAYRESFTSRVTLNEPHHIKVDYIRGPLKYLHNEWFFQAVGNNETMLRFSVDFAFRNKVFKTLAGRYFMDAVKKMSSAFEERAHSMYNQQFPSVKSVTKPSASASWLTANPIA